MSGSRSGWVRRRVMALVLTGSGALGMLTIGQAVSTQASSAAATDRCIEAQTDLSFTSVSPARVVAHGECFRSTGDNGAALFVKLFRNGTLVFSGGNGVGIVNAIYTCQGSAVSDFQAVWSTGQTDEASFPCG